MQTVFKCGFGKRRRDLGPRFREMPPPFEMQRDNRGIRERASERNAISRAHREVRRSDFGNTSGTHEQDRAVDVCMLVNFIDALVPYRVA